MIKLLHKKDISTEESPIMLQRRHTIMDVDKECNLAEPKLKSIARSNSTSSLNKTKNKHSDEKAADTTLSPEGSISASNASTVVITESELSSSWIYNNKKAQMKNSEAKSPRNSPSRTAEVNDEMRSPMLPKSKMRSNSMVGGRTKKSSCCCYALIILIIGIATLGILTAIASILYVEFFASYNITDIQITTPKSISQDSVPLKKVGHSLDVESQKVLDPTKLPGRASESVLFPHSSAKDTEKGISNEKQNSFKDVLEVDEKNRIPVNETVDSSSVIIDDLLNITSNMINSVISDQKEISNPINAFFSRNQNLESHYSKLFELYQGLRPIGSNIEKSEKSEPSKPIPQTSVVSTDMNISVNNNLSSMQRLDEDENSNIQEKVNFDITKDSSDAVDEISSELGQDSSMVDENIAEDSSVDDTKAKNGVFVVDSATEDSSVSDVARGFSVVDMSKDLSVVAQDSFHFRLNNIIEENDVRDFLNTPHQNPSKQLEFTPKEIVKFNQEADETVPDSEKVETSDKSIQRIQEEDNLKFPNSFRTLDIDFEDDKIQEEQPNVPDQDPPLANLPIVGATNSSNFIPKFLSQFDRNWGISTLFRNSDEDSQQTSVSADEADSVDLNRPILEANIAIPRPVEIIKRFGHDVNEKSDQSGDLTEHDRRFSLAKALDRLRLLDANNILPSSRQSKTASPKKKEEPKIQTDQEVATERSHYLENLRKKFFDNE